VDRKVYSGQCELGSGKFILTTWRQVDTAERKTLKNTNNKCSLTRATRNRKCTVFALQPVNKRASSFFIKITRRTQWYYNDKMGFGKIGLLIDRYIQNVGLGEQTFTVRVLYRIPYRVLECSVESMSKKVLICICICILHLWQMSEPEIWYFYRMFVICKKSWVLEYRMSLNAEKVTWAEKMNMVSLIIAHVASHKSRY